MSHDHHESHDQDPLPGAGLRRRAAQLPASLGPPRLAPRRHYLSRVHQMLQPAGRTARAPAPLVRLPAGAGLLLTAVSGTRLRRRVEEPSPSLRPQRLAPRGHCLPRVHQTVQHAGEPARALPDRALRPAAAAAAAGTGQGGSLQVARAAHFKW
ncbi:hypothetical protein FJT64_008343 [Amphibalanus amphitrite]|uniref:Uncharacterized protein n=1 Tax=Amphibalanus amphitrite TaxID=1232801 RepID=A0A6A4VX38_AMPAM|nr:hypothetical protein FJT64_008343 [Amphibalanus amphitrite]